MDSDEYNSFLFDVCQPFADAYASIIDDMQHFDDLRPDQKDILKEYAEESPFYNFIPALYGCLVAKPGSVIYEQSERALEQDLYTQCGLDPEIAETRAAFAKEFLKGKPIAQSIDAWLEAVKTIWRFNKRPLMDNGKNPRFQQNEPSMGDLARKARQLFRRSFCPGARTDVFYNPPGFDEAFAKAQGPKGDVPSEGDAEAEYISFQSGLDFEDIDVDDEQAYAMFRAQFRQDFALFEDLMPEVVESIGTGKLKAGQRDLINQYEDEDVIIPNLQVICKAPNGERLYMEALARMEAFLIQINQLNPERARMTVKAGLELYAESDNGKRHDFEDNEAEQEIPALPYARSHLTNN